MAKRGRSDTMQVLLNGRLVGALRLAGSGAISYTYPAFRDESRAISPSNMTSAATNDETGSR
jgi:hypothetical protein